jgi:hypothetical protein
MVMSKGGRIQINRIIASVPTGGRYFIGINYNANSLIKEKVTVWEEVSVMLSSAVVMLSTGIFAVLFISSENNCGFLKNIVNRVKKRRYILYADVIAMSVFVLLEFLIILLATGFGCILFPDNISFEMPMAQIQCIGLKLLLFIAFSVFLVLVSSVINNSAISMIICMFLSLGIITAVLGCTAELIAENFDNTSLEYLSDYMVVRNIQVLSISSLSEIGHRALLVVFGAVFAYGGMAAFVIEKRDIK